MEYPLYSKLPPNAPALVIRAAGFDGEMQGLKNGVRVKFKVGEITAMLNTRSLELYAPHVYIHSTTPSIVAQDEVKKVLDPIALKFEAELARHARFSLQRTRSGSLVSIRLRVEYAEEEHRLAYAKPKGYKFAVHGPEGRERVKIDYSRGKRRPELEYVDGKTAPHDRDVGMSELSAITNRDFNALLDERVSILGNAESIEELRRLHALHASELGKITEVLKMQAEQNAAMLERWASEQEVARERYEGLLKIALARKGDADRLALT